MDSLLKRILFSLIDTSSLVCWLVLTFCAYRYQWRMSNIIDDVLEWSPKLALSGLMENQPPVKITMCSYLCRKHAWSLNNVQNVLGIDCYASKRLNTLVEPYSSYASKNKDKSINAPDWGEVVTCGSLLPLQAGTILVFWFLLSDFECMSSVYSESKR